MKVCKFCSFGLTRKKGNWLWAYPLILAFFASEKPYFL